MAQISAQKCDFSCNGVAVFYCKGCSQGLCVNCRQNVHDKVQLFKDHEVVIIEKEGNLAFRPQPVCDTHKKTFICYCSRCDCLTCAECMTDNHNEHKTENIKKIAGARRENVNQIIEKLKSKVDKVEQNLATIETKHYCRIKSDCESYVKRVEEITDELRKMIDQHKLIPITTASDFQYNENEVLDKKTAYFKQRYNETADRLLKFENLLQETHDSTFLSEWKSLQVEVQLINEETDDQLSDPPGITIFDQDKFIKSVIGEIDHQFKMRLKEQEESVTSLTKEIAVLTDELKGKQEQIDDLSKLTRQLKEKKKEVTELFDENENLKTEIKRKNQEELSKLKEQENTATCLKNEVDELKRELKRKNEQIDDLSKQDVPNTDISKSGNQEEHKMMQVRLRVGEQHHVKEKIEKPSQPYVTEVNKSDLIILKWEHNGELGTEEFYKIIMKQHPDGKWKNFQTPKPCIKHFVTIDGLAADTSYVFKVRVENTLGEEGPFSSESDVITTSESLALGMMMKSELIGVGSPKIYRLPIQEVIEARNERSQTRKFILGTPRNSVLEKTIMIVGATGSGKSTLINKMANYVLGVNWKDPFRFTLEHLEACEIERVGNEGLSQTKWITCYTIYQDVACQIDYTINIIDTPGFGHGLEQDAKIISQIRDLLTAMDQKGVSTLDAVCFILNAPDARLTTTQKYIFESILALFGNDIKNNICTLITFADGQKPPVGSALKSLDGKPLPFETYFSFNNSALFVDNRSDHQGLLSPFFWDMGMKSCGEFFRMLYHLRTKSLLLTSEVLKNRQKLDRTILHLQEEIDVGLSKINLLEQQFVVFTKYNQEMHDNENFVTSGYANRVKKVNYQMKDNYHRAYQKKTSQEQVLEEMFGDMQILEVGIQTKTEKISEYGNRLKEIALRPDPLSNSDLIELFILSEKREKKLGYIQRIESLQQCKKRAEIGKTCQMFEHRLRETRLKMKASVDD